jgi:ABC-2 type transport system ATP-binding protein
MTGVRSELREGPTPAPAAGAAPDDAPPGVARLHRVSKWYGPVIALNDATATLAAGITGLVGPNGAGKSTLIKLLTGQLRPSLGEVRIAGRPAWSAAAKSHVGYCPDTDAFYEEMSGRAFVRLIARLHGFGRQEACQRAEQLLERVGMAGRASRPLASYSKGMRQRIKLAQALIHDPDLLVLDEPLNGVDPLGRRELLEHLQELAGGGKAILVSSHVLDELDRVADRAIFLCRGRVIASGTPQEVRRLLSDHPLRVRIETCRPRALAARLLLMTSVQGVTLEGERELVLEVRQPPGFFRGLAEIAVGEDFALTRLQVLDDSTEAVFEYLMEAALRP